MKKMMFLLCACMALLRCFGQPTPYMHTQGKDIVDAEGKPFYMRGTNLGNWLVPEGYMFGFTNTNSPRLINEAFCELVGPAYTANFWKKFQQVYVTRQDIEYLKSLGMNSLRIPFNYRLFTSEDYMGSSDENRGFPLLDSVLSWCKAAQLYVILDMHAAPGGQTGDNIDDGYGYPFLFTDPDSQQQTIDIWQRIARHYSHEPIIMGYDLLNEPIAHFFDSSFFNPLLEPLYKRIASAIREVDTHHILFLGGAQWNSNFAPFSKPWDDNVVYTFHKYWTDTTRDVIQPYLDFRDKYNVPIYVGETGENSDTWVAGFRRLMEKENIGWHFWPYKKLDNTSGIVTFAKPAHYDSVVAYTKKDRSSFEKIRQARPVNIQASKQALEDFLENSRFEHCRPNKGYIQALGLKAD